MMRKTNQISNGVKRWIFAVFILCLLFGGFASNSALAQSEKIQIDFFYSETCPHCADEEEFLTELKGRYPEIEIRRYEVTRSEENQQILKNFYENYNVSKAEMGWIPVTFTPVEFFIGFNQQVAVNIENCLKDCLDVEKEAPQKIGLPFAGNVDISKMSLPVLTVVLGAFDGFNPCAMWVLLFLIALLINTRSRARMWLIAGTFILTSGVVYFLILSAWLNLFLAISYVNLTRILIGVLAVGVGIWQLKNFITYHPGVCRAMGLKARLGGGLKTLAEKMVSSPFTWAMIGGIILMALGVNLIEFFCSAGLPAIYTRILAMSGLDTLNYYLYLLLYTFVFMLDDFIIFFLAIITLSKIGFTEKYNYWTTLIGGLLILILGFLLIFKPELLIFN